MTRLHTGPLAAALALLMAGTGLADELPRTISVTGQGKATAAPDLATIHTGVESQAATAAEALAANNAAMEKIEGVIKQQRMGIVSPAECATHIHTLIEAAPSNLRTYLRTETERLGSGRPFIPVGVKTHGGARNREAI